MSEALKRAFKPYEGDLQLIKSHLLCICASVNDSEASERMVTFLNNSGHMLRPTLALLVFKLIKNRGDYPKKKQHQDQAGTESAIHALAAAIELLHTASLVHDDVLDASDERRGKATLNADLGNHSAVLMGNLFYLSAFKIAMTFETPLYVNSLIRTTEIMCIGEIRQKDLSQETLTIDQYLDVVEKKSGALVATAMSLAASLAGANEEDVHYFERLGLVLGVLYQLRDDREDQDMGNVSQGVSQELRQHKSEEARFLSKQLRNQFHDSSEEDLSTLVGIIDFLI